MQGRGGMPAMDDFRQPGHPQSDFVAQSEDSHPDHSGNVVDL